MKKVILFLCTVLFLGTMVGCSSQNAASSESSSPVNANSEVDSQLMIREEATSSQEAEAIKISVRANGNTIVYELNDSPAAIDFYVQLPLTIEVENFSTNEKVFYPPKQLSTTDTPLANTGNGTLAYYEPWGDVVMFYDDFDQGNRLFELGHVVSGEEFIETLSGTIQVTAIK